MRRSCSTNTIGERSAGKLHAPFDGGEAETRATARHLPTLQKLALPPEFISMIRRSFENYSGALSNRVGRAALAYLVQVTLESLGLSEAMNPGLKELRDFPSRGLALGDAGFEDAALVVLHSAGFPMTREQLEG